ncbi:MAG: hypothetical protein FJZ01_12310 [Candidatus Sericytochromatia bacterium]|nr:hypothetical protein [Candidatus Tanganyikabacteria bacterium]
MTTKIDGSGQTPLAPGTKKTNAAEEVCPPEETPSGMVALAPPDKADTIKGSSSEIAPTSAPHGSMPQQQVSSVEWCEPEEVKPVERTIEVAGAGMGASKKYSMLESEALAVYTIIRDNKGSVSPEKLQAELKSRYGIDAEITRVDGHIALVNKATGNAIAVDTEGNGALGFEDLQFKDALLAAGIDPDRKKPHFNPFDLAMKVITEANEASKKRQQEYEASVARAGSAGAGKSGGQAGTEAGPTGTSSPGPAPAAPISSPPASTAPKSSGY